MQTEAVQEKEQSPEQVVARQLEAYNAHDIESFMAHWATHSRYYEYPEGLLANGHDQIRARHTTRFNESPLHGELVNRIVLGNRVIDHEMVTRRFPEGVGVVEVVAVYIVEDGKIVDARFAFGKPEFDD